MQDIIRLQKKVVPELMEVLEKRYNILRTIEVDGPIGRRVLSSELELSERIVRTEISFLKTQGLIEINTPGMTVTESGREVVEKLEGFIHELKGLNDLEVKVKEKLNVKKVIIVPGDVDNNFNILKDIGKAASKYLKSVIKEDSIIALTGGSSVREVIESFPKINKYSKVLVVPARGGMGKKVETQANTLAGDLAKKLNAHYKLLHIPENISPEILDTLKEEKEIKEIVQSIHNADILIYGIGDAMKMAQKRGISEEKISKLNDLEAVGEAFGCYFNKDSKVVSETTAIGININNAREVATHIAVAGGKSKVESIIATQLNNTHAVLVTDEAVGHEILNCLKTQ
ncbi:MAG: sugar-binding transcriptional regulator [Clostridium sp.]|uniref:sugar-binding transcriptional regulator n=1 Tax=Clostridium sp. TaxID=1506 RepID=UPI003F344BA1